MSMPARLGRYAVRRRIGSGGFATVWLAYDEQLDSPVAIKVLADNWTEDHQIRRRSADIFEGGFAVGYGVNMIMLSEQTTDVLTHIGIVIGHQHAGLRLRLS